MLGQQRLLEQGAEGADDHGHGLGLRDGRARLDTVHVFGLDALDAQQRGLVSATGGEASLRPRPRGRSGRVTTSLGRCAWREPLENVGGELRGAEVDGGHAGEPRCTRREARRGRIGPQPLMTSRIPEKLVTWTNKMR